MAESLALTAVSLLQIRTALTLEHGHRNSHPFDGQLARDHHHPKVKADGRKQGRQALIHVRVVRCCALDWVESVGLLGQFCDRNSSQKGTRDFAVKEVHSIHGRGDHWEFQPADVVENSLPKPLFIQEKLFAEPPTLDYVHNMFSNSESERHFAVHLNEREKLLGLLAKRATGRFVATACCLGGGNSGGFGTRSVCSNSEFPDCKCRCCSNSDAHPSDDQGPYRDSNGACACDNRPRIPPDHAVADTGFHARADSVPQLLQSAHPFIPLWTGRHSATAEHRWEKAYG